MDDETPILALLDEPRRLVNDTLRRYLDRLDHPRALHDAIVYALLGGGKRLRPVLCWYAGVAAGDDGRRTLAPAAAVELVHAFSLVHDDLPAMDDDDLRRGHPTLHIHAGEAMAILAGDAMLALAFDLIATEPAFDAQTARRLFVELTTGTRGMICGQVYDTLGGFSDELSDRQRLDLIHRNKTGALLRAAARMGVIAAGASADVLASVTRYADDAGLMFQIVDDLMDVRESSEHVGKRTGKDVAAGKLTFPAVLGVAGSEREIERLCQSASEAIAPLGDRARPLGELVRYLARRTR
ncbi:MAG: polyprenyl synthetase family protein [Phycisphaerales bacterium]|nr:polyprenyl synthetase family protein [Phycisphaerales bacterium]